MDKERRDKNWDAIIKYNDVRTNEEWTMDLKESKPPPNLLLCLPAYQQDTKPPAWKRKDSKEKKNKGGGGDKQSNKPKSWKYVPPKLGKPDTKAIKNANGQQEKGYWCANAACHCWTLRHSTAGHGKEEERGNHPRLRI
jgi:hypothetical protein